MELPGQSSPCLDRPWSRVGILDHEVLGEVAEPEKDVMDVGLGRKGKIKEVREKIKEVRDFRS